jgi:hypothetical protein
MDERVYEYPSYDSEPLAWKHKIVGIHMPHFRVESAIPMPQKLDRSHEPLAVIAYLGI